MRQSRENRFCLFLLLLILINVFDNVNADSSGTVGRNRRTGNLTDMCAYRETQFPGKIFLLHASWGCYRYTRDDMFVGGIIPVRGCIVQDDDESRTNYTAPGVLFNGICTPFSHTSEVINTIVTNSFQNENMVQRWIDCTEDALDCCKTVLSRHNVEGNYCAATWDAWTCYEPAEAGTNVKEVCSTYSYIALPPRCLRKEILINFKRRKSI